jgi:hypothetical protein
LTAIRSAPAAIRSSYITLADAQKLQFDLAPPQRACSSRVAQRTGRPDTVNAVVAR